MDETVVVTSPRVIAEIGTAHEGNLDRAKQLIKAAGNAGAQTAKFQLVIADEILHPLSGSVDLPGGTFPLYDRFRELERDTEYYHQLQEICREEGIGFLCTPFGIESARILYSLGVDEYKIASPELNHHPLLKEVASYQKPMILSTGVARLRDISESLDYIASLNTKVALQLLHCVTSYPAREEEYNLRVIPALKSICGYPVGISDHTMDPILVPALATILGAVTIEKHITLNRNASGLDDPIALDPQCFALMVAEVHDIGHRLAQATNRVELEQVRMNEIQRLQKRYGEDRVNSVLGDGVKKLAPSEVRHYGFTNRSIHAVDDIPVGTTLSSDKLAILRSEKNLTPGLHPRYWEIILDRKVVVPVRAGEGLRWEHL